MRNLLLTTLVATANLAGVAIILANCATPADLEVKTGPGTSYPCGVTGVLCATQKTCCGQDETCGGEPGSVGCPAGECCFIGPSEFGAKKPHKQRPLDQPPK